MLVINAMGCRPPLGAGEVEKKKATEACRPWFESMLKRWGGGLKVPVLVMGKWAQVALTGLDEGVGENRGYIRKLPSGRIYMASHHPTYAFFHNPYSWGAFTVDMLRWSRLIHGKLEKAPQAVKEGTLAELQLLWKAAQKAGFFSFDLETRPVNGDTWGLSAKDPDRALIHLVSVGVEHEGKCWGISFTWNKMTPATKALLKKMLASPAVTKVGVNIRWFDEPILERYGMKVEEPTADLRDMRRATSSTSPVSLHYLGSILTWDGAGPWKKSFNEEDIK